MFSAGKDKKLEADKDSMSHESCHIGSDLENAAHRFNGSARETASAMKDDLEIAARRTGQHVRELADSAGHSFTDVSDIVATKIRNNPVQSALIALGVGVVAGILYRR